MRIILRVRSEIRPAGSLGVLLDQRRFVGYRLRDGKRAQFRFERFCSALAIGYPISAIGLISRGDRMVR